MIELLRYARLKPDGVVSAKVTTEGLVCVTFERFDVQTGRKIAPEESLLTFTELETRLGELQTELGVVNELLALRPKA